MKKKGSYARYARPPRDPRKSRYKWIMPLCIGLLLFGAVTVALVTVFSTLNKVNRNLSQKNVDSQAVAEETIDKTGFEDLFGGADDAIRANEAMSVLRDPNVTNVLLAGLDYGGNENLKNQIYPRADAIILLSANKHTKKISMVSFSRATYVAIPGYKNGRLNLAHAYGGAELLVKTIELNYKIGIDAFMTVDFDSFITLVDMLEGIELTLDQQEYDALKESCYLSDGPGSYLFDGTQTLRYARLRYVDSDRARTQRQRNILNQIVSKVRGLSFGQLRNCVNRMLPYVSTDMSNGDLLRLLPFAGYSSREAIIPRKAVPLTEVNGIEVLILNWNAVYRDVRELLYAQ
ncbi:MAG: LCP family protein [Oscillospiraceae bacterium]|jgi:LCP family protein required for cell wall assembly|nr:LCP family protein [Oscillospiraceae bacterium]